MGHKFKKIKNNIQPETVSNKKNVWFVLLLLIVSAFSVLITFLVIRQTNFNAVKQDLKKYHLIDPSRSVVDQENFLSSIEPVRKQMKELVAKYEKEGDSIGVYLEFLNTGANISINQDTRFWPASLSKMPTVMIVMKRIEDGKWKLSNQLVLFEEDKDDRFGDLYKQPVGTKFTIEELIKQVLINSDNTAHKILIRNLNSGEYDEMFAALGMEELFNKDYDITAKEYSRIFRSLYTASYLNRENSQKILTWLSESNFNEFLGSGIDEKTVFSHKIGEEYKKVVFLDSGIVYVPGKPYLITAMVKVKDGGDVAHAQGIMKELSKSAYDYFSSK
jgi:beta-lactamase class A